MRSALFVGFLFVSTLQFVTHAYVIDLGHSNFLVIPDSNISSDSVIQKTATDHDDIASTIEKDSDSDSSERAWAFEEAAAKRSASHFTRKFDRPLKKQRKNYVSSPLSAWMILTMFYAGSNSSTQNKIREVLEIPDDDGVKIIGISHLYTTFRNFIHSDFSFDNAIYGAVGTPTNDDFSYELNVKGDAIDTSLNFSETKLAIKEINKIVKADTGYHVNNVVNLDDIKSNTSLIALSAAYFKGSFNRAFKPATVGEFYASEFEVKIVPIMNVRASFLYGRIPHANASYVEIPYQRENNHNMSMFVIRPDYIDGIHELRKQEFDVKELLMNGVMEEVDIYLPKFNISTKINLEHNFRKLGLGELFESPDLSGISESHLVVDKMIQKVSVEVDEQGAIPPSAEDNETLNDDIVFNADRPFLAIIATVDKNPVTLFKLYYQAAEQLERNEYIDKMKELNQNSENDRKQ